MSMFAMSSRFNHLECIFISFLMILPSHGYNGAKMGILSDCDDANSNLQVDWDENDFTEYTCSGHKWSANSSVKSEFYRIPNFDPLMHTAMHYCMNISIHYNDTPPLIGAHRPNWAFYGEYLYLPQQRWLHNLEHGSIALLYHPCVKESELAKLRKLVTKCLFRHIITPYRQLSKEHPLALIAWGASLKMNVMNEKKSIDFIKNNARKGKEDLSKQGKYDSFLIQKSKVVNHSDIDDSNICP